MFGECLFDLTNLRENEVHANKRFYGVLLYFELWLPATTIDFAYG